MSGFIGSAKLNCIYRFDGFDSPTFGDQSNFFYEPLHLFSIALNILVLSGPEKKPSFLFCFHTFLFFFSSRRTRRIRLMERMVIY